MRSRTISRLLAGQDVCFFCAFRYGVEARPMRRPLLPQTRSYKVTTRALHPPAAAAVAREEDDGDDGRFGLLAANNAASHLPPPRSAQPPDPPPQRQSNPHPHPEHRNRLPQPPTTRKLNANLNPFESMPDWQCRCKYVNLPNKTSCSKCGEARQENVKLFYPKKSPGRPLFMNRGEPAPLNPIQMFDEPFDRSGGRASGRADRIGDGVTIGSHPSGKRIPGSSFDPSASQSKFGEQNSPSSLTGQVLHSGGDTKSGFSAILSKHVFSQRRTPAWNQSERATPRARSVNSDTWTSSPSKNVGVFGVEELTRQRESGVSRRERSWSSHAPRNQASAGSNDVPRLQGNIGPFSSTAAPAPLGKGMGVFGMSELQKISEENRSSRSGKSSLAKANEKDRGKRFQAPKSSAMRVPMLSMLELEEVALSKNRVNLDKSERRRERFANEDDIQEPLAPKFVSKGFKRQHDRDFRFDPEYDIDMIEQQFYDDRPSRKNKGKGRKGVTEALSKPQIQLPDFISVEKLAQALKVKVDDFIVRLEEEGFEGPRYDHILDVENSAILADLYGFDPVFSAASPHEDLVARPLPDDRSSIPPRPPIVTIMGHVDHGKTTILDWLRKSSVAETEHGGITQHIGAFSFTMPGTERRITFLDTPGHSAFLDMRRRGANVTDIVVLVVAADDSVKPQTIEAIKHALEAKVQIIVAVNKIDKEDAKVDRVKQDLSRHGIIVEEFGGDVQAIPVSGKTGQGMADLEEAISTLADVADYRAEVNGPVEGWVLESKVGLAGRVATVLVRRGTLRPGDFIVAGSTWARVRTLRNDAGQLVDEAAPGTPVQVDGWRGEDPTAGLEVLQANNEDHAKNVVDIRLGKIEMSKTAADMAAINQARTEEAEARAKVLAWEAEQEWSKKRYGHRPKDNEGWVEGSESAGPKLIHFVIKGDVAGSVEALVASVTAIGSNEIVANVIHSGVGQLAESDIRLLAATGEVGYAISFNQPVDGTISRLAADAGLHILDHNIIYKVTDDVKEKLSAELPPLVTQHVLGEAEIGQVFEISVKKQKMKIAGCRVVNGVISRSTKVRVFRKGEQIYAGMLSSLKNVKKDVTEMRKGTECGMGFDEWEDFCIGDQVQTYEERETKRTLY